MEFYAFVLDLVATYVVKVKNPRWMSSLLRLPSGTGHRTMSRSTANNFAAVPAWLFSNLFVECAYCEFVRMLQNVGKELRKTEFLGHVKDE